MFRRTLVFIGTITISLIALLGLIWFASPSFSVAHAKSPAIDTANTALPRPLRQVPPGCVPIISDIGSNTTWTGSCYHVMTSTVAVYPGVSLVINPPSAGTWVYFEDGTQLQVLGDLQALGTAAKPITFTAVHTSNPWLGIILEQDTGGDCVQHSVIEYAQTGVRINDEDSVTIQFNTFRHNRLGATGGGGVGGDTDSSFITNNTIHDCSNGVTLNESFSNDISGNTIYDIEQYGVALVAKTTVGGNSNTINNNEIHDCGLNSIRLESGDSNTVQGNTVYQSGNAGLVIDEQSSASVQNNQVFDNAQDAGAPAGILVTNGSENVEITANRILSNGSNLGGYVAAIYVQDMSSVFNQLTVNDNVIHDTYGTGVYYAADNRDAQTVMQANAICSVPSFELDNQRASHTIDALYGWWGTNTPVLGVNYAGSVDLTPWITLAVTTVPTAVPGNVGSTVNVLVTMNDGAGHAVPNGARQVRLASSSGTLNPSVVTLDSNGQALSTFTLTEIPPGDQVTISATAFCDYVASAILTVERTNVAIHKEASATQAMAGGQLVYQITYSNTTDVVATNVYITDSLPAGTAWAGDTAAASGWTRLSTSPQPVWSIPTLSPGAYGSFALTVDVPASAACGALLTNWVNIGTDTAETTAADNTASAGPVEVIQPSVLVSKTGDAHSKVGDVVTYQFQITNNSCPASSPPLILDSVVDTGIGWAGLGSLTNVARANGCDPLSYGASCSFTVQHTVQAGEPDPLHNGVDVHYHPQGFTTDVSDSDVHSVNLFQPSITFDKTGDAQSKVGDDVDYVLTLDNTSSLDAPDLACTITDAMLGIDQNVTLASGGSHVINATYTVPGGATEPLVNTAQVSCSPIGFPNVLTANDTHSVDLFQPSITFEKTGDAQSKVGDDVDYVLTLNNTSSPDAPDLACTITDAMLGIDQNVTLASGGSHVINATYTVPGGATDPLVNTAQVSCSPIGFPNVLTDSDSHSVDLFQPNVQVAKTGPIAAYVDDTITYTFHVTNASSLDSPPLVLDSAIDVGTGWPGLGDLTTVARANGCDPLPAGDTCSFAVPHTLSDCSPGPLTNTVTVHYRPQGFTNDVAHFDSHTVEIERAVNLFVTKHDDVDASSPLRPTFGDSQDEDSFFDRWLLTMGSSSPLAPVQSREFAFEGDVVTYTITVINTGSYTATNVVLTETLPLYTEYLGYGWTHVHSRTYTLPVGTLPPDAWQIRHFVARITDTLPYTVNEVINRVCGGSAEHDIDPTENCRYENTPVRRRLVLTKTPAVLGITPGNTITFTVFYSNPNSVAFGDARLTDTLPAGTVWSGDTAAAGGWTRLQTTPQVVWTMPTMAPGTQGSFVLSVTVPAAATCGVTLTNVIALSVPNDGTSYPAASDTADFRLLCPIDLLAIKNDNVGSTQQRAFVYEGDLITYTVVVLNVGTNTVNNVVLSETLPAYTDYVGQGWTHVSGSTYITTVGTLTPGTGRPYYFTVRVHDALPEDISYIANKVCTWGTEPDDYLANNCSGEDTPIHGRLLHVAKSAPDCISPGDVFTYTITYVNDVADITFSNVVLTDTLDPFVSYAGGPEWSCAGQVCNRTIPSIPPATSGSMPLQVQLSPAFPIATRTIVTNVVEIDDGQRFVLAHTADTGPDLAVVKHDHTAFVQPGQLLTYTIVYSNVGFGTATGVVLTERLPDQTSYAGGGWTQVGASQYYILNVGDLTVGQHAQARFVVRVNDPFMSTDDRVVNQVDIAAQEPECNTDNNLATDDTPVQRPSLQVIKTVEGPVSPGDTFTYTVTYQNTTTDTTWFNVVLTDTLDPFVSYAGGPEWSRVGQICNRTIPSVPPATSGSVLLRVQLSPGFPIATRSIVTNVIEIDGGQRFVLVHTVGARPDLVVAKHDDATFVQAGQLLTYTIVYSNVGVGAATGVVLTETLPLYTSYVGYGWTQVDARTYTLAVGTLLPNDWGSRTFVVRVTDTLPSGVNYLTNLVCGGSEGEDLDPSDNCATEDTPTTLRPYVTKTTVAPEASAGEIFTFTVNYGNPSSNTLTGALITDVLPVDTHWHGDTASVVGWTRQTVANGQVVWSKPTLAAGEHGSFALSVIVSPTNPALCGTTLANVIRLSAFSNGERQYADPATAPFGLTCSVNLVLDMNDEVELTSSLMRLPVRPLQVSQQRDFVVPGDLITYTFSIANQGWVTATNVVISDTLPLYTTYVDRGDGWQPVGATRYYTVSLPDLPPGTSETVYFVVRVDDPLPSHVRDITNYACAYSSEPDSDPTDNCRLETAPVLGLTVNKTANPTSVEPGHLVTYTITLDNLDQISGFSPSGGITLTDALPTGFTYVGDTAASAGFARLATSPVVVWHAPTTTLGSNVSFSLVARAPAAINCANWITNTVTASLTLNGQPYDWVATAGVWIPCPIDLLVLKDDDVGPTALMSAEASPTAGTHVTMDQLLRKAQVNAPLAPVQHRSFVREGDLITYTIVVANAGTSAVTNATVSETLPLYTDYVGHGWTYLGGRTYVMTAGTLPPGSVGIYYFVVRVYDTLPDGVETLVNQVCGWADEPDQYPQNNCNYEDTPVRRRPLQVTKVADPCISPGDAFDYTITYQNISTGTIFYNVLLTDTLDPYVSYTGGPEWSCAGGICNQSIPAIPPGVSGTLQLPAQLSASFPAAQTAFTNTVVISGGNRFVLVTPVDTATDLSVLKNDNVGPLPLALQTQWNDLRQRLFLSRQPASVQATQQREFVYPGELITYTILYINTGQTTATNVELTERLPDYTSYVGGGWTHAGGQQYTLSVGDLAPGQGGEVQFIVRVSDFFPPGEARVINRVSIAGQETECNLSNNQSDEDTPVHPYPLQVIKTADTCIMPGDEFNYTVTYQNTTTDTTYANVVLTDTLSPYVTYAGGPEWTCVGQTCNRTIATIPPGESDSFPLRVQLSASFPYTMQTVFTNVVAISGGNRYLLITSIDVGPDLALVKNDNVGLAPPGLQQPEVVLPGELITYTILYINGGLGPATNVLLTETLPQHTTYAGDASWQDAGGGLYTRSVGNLAAGQGRMTSFVVQVDDPLPANANWAINQVEIGSETPECNLTNNQSFEQTPLSSDGVLTFTLHKDGPMSTYPNSVITYTIVTVNNGPSAPGVTLSDAVPNGTIFIPGSCSYSINSGPSQPCDADYPDPSDVMWQEDLATGDRVVTTFSVRVAVGTMGVVMLQNCATLDWGSGQMADCADTMVVLPFLEKTGPATAGSGERITYTVVSENNTDMPIPDANLSDPIPNGASFVPGTCSYSVNGGTSQACALDYPTLSDVMWQEDLAPGDRITTTFSVVVITGTMGVADVQNCATLGWQGSQTVNCFTTRITSTGPILYKTAPQVACQNDVITYTIVASNVTGLAVPGVILSDTIPNGTIYVPGSCYYQVNAGPPQPCGLPPLLWQEDFAPGDHITTTFAVTVTAGTMGWPIGNCAVFNWGGRQLWACASTIVGRCDQRVYVANRDSGTVDVFDLNGYSYVETIPMGINPFGMVMIGDFLFAVDFDEPANRGRLYVVNTLLDRVVDSPLVGAHPVHIAAYDHHIYVASHSSRPAITVYDYVSGQVVAQPVLDRHLTYEFGFFGATTDENRGCVYLTKRDFGSLGIWRICPPSSSGPWIPEFVYGTNETNREKPSSILYHPDLDRVYVTFGLIDELWVFDPETWQLVERLPTGVQDPTDPGYGGHGLTSLGECVFVANYIGQSVTAVVDGSCVDRTRVMSTPPDPSTTRAHRVYLPLVIKNFQAGHQGPQQQRIVTIPVSGRPKGLVAGADNLLFVTMPEDGSGNPLNRIAVIDTETLQVVHEIQTLGDHPHTVILRQITTTGTRSKPSGTLLLP